MIALLFAVLMVGAASGEAKVACKLPMYIQAPHAPGDATTDTVNLFLYGLKSAVRQHQGCVVDKMADAHLGLYVTTVNLVNARGTQRRFRDSGGAGCSAEWGPSLYGSLRAHSPGNGSRRRASERVARKYRSDPGQASLTRSMIGA